MTQFYVASKNHEFKNLNVHLPKLNGWNPQNEGLDDGFSLFRSVIFRFQPFVSNANPPNDLMTSVEARNPTPTVSSVKIHPSSW